MLNRYILSIVLILGLSEAAMFQTVSPKKATMTQTGKAKNYCPNCGMHLGKFYKTNHVHKDHQYCSMHCLVENNKDSLPADAKVVDTNSLKFIDATKAFYVVGSKKKGTMTMNSKYAFASKDKAKKFQAKNGGEIKTFKEAYEIARGDFKKDMKMIGKKRSKKVYKMGKKMYNKKCQKDKIDVKSFDKISSLKAHIKDNKLCGKKIKDKQLQAICVYLWDVEKLGITMANKKAILVPKDAKCPVCGMFVAKYPKWVATVTHGKHMHYFDGVKDMMKFIFSQNQKFTNIKVTDYFTTSGMKAKKAFYVVGSTVYGPMGHELIPFSNMAQAQEFKKNRNGTKIVRFEDITKELVLSLDK